MPRQMKIFLMSSFAAAVLAGVMFRFFHRGIYLSLAITFGTIAFHLGIRLLIGWMYNVKMGNRADYTKNWYQLRPWEKKLYQLLKVKKWKGKMPVYEPELFSPEKHTWDEIAQAMCQSELVHETNAVFSFLPLIASVWFGSFPVFLLTSIGGAVFDLLFVVMQRYNRPRILKMIQKGDRQKSKQRIK